MRKVLIGTVLVILLFMMTVSTGCTNGKVDWKAVSQTAIKVALTQFLIPAYDQYAGDEDAVVAKVIAELKKLDLIDKYMNYVDVEKVLRAIYKIVDANWYKVLRENGYDTDADTPEPKPWYVSATDFPEILELEV